MIQLAPLVSKPKAMDQPRIEDHGDGHIVLSGRLNFTTVPRLWQEGNELFARYPELLVDLGDVTYSDSSGIALLVEWLRYGKRQKKQVTFKSIPPQMLAIARFSGLESLLPLSE